MRISGLCSGEGDDERTFSMTVKQVAVVDFAQIKTITDTKKVRGVLQVCGSHTLGKLSANLVLFF